MRSTHMHAFISMTRGPSQQCTYIRARHTHTTAREGEGEPIDKCVFPDRTRFLPMFFTSSIKRARIKKYIAFISSFLVDGSLNAISFFFDTFVIVVSNARLSSIEPPPFLFVLQPMKLRFVSQRYFYKFNFFFPSLSLYIYIYIFLRNKLILLLEFFLIVNIYKTLIIKRLILSIRIYFPYIIKWKLYK